MSELALHNRHRGVVVDRRRFRRWLLEVLADPVFFGPAAAPARWLDFELAFFLVTDPVMGRLNERHLGHAGSTDVITFDYGRPPGAGAGTAWLRGDLFVCPDEARRQARRFRADWPAEIARCVIHGLLHLAGHDDLEPAARRAMKQVENRLVRCHAACFPLSRRKVDSKLPP
ncbi:MAG TPA: rRNA maturation RNase YbeY [Verrucomicrobiota bacterium]|nr:rRNA maturation RNase YbeY [Verrucomicrobiota bacterium]HNU51552.1 rRNA maturation RNase YbeY [Verrucomicrobiota bacterium]